MSKEEIIKELLKWVSSDSLLVIDKNGLLTTCILSIQGYLLGNLPPEIKVGEKVSVDAVKLTVEVKEVFIIKGIAYYIIFFRIIL